MFINSKLKVKNKEMIGLAKFKFLKIYYKKLDHQFIEVYSYTSTIFDELNHPEKKIFIKLLEIP